MRHGKKFNHLSRKTAHRKAMLSNMACSLIEHKRISTTIAKAKALRVYVEPILTKSKTDSTHSRRTVFSYLQNKEALSELFREIAPRIADRPGGYTRIIRTGYRVGDNAEMCMIELVDFNDIYVNEGVKKTTRRSRRGGTKATTEGAVETAETVENTEAKVEAIEAKVEATEATVETTEAEVEAKEATVEVEVKEETEPKVEATKETEAKVETTEEAPAKEKKTTKAKEENPKAEAKPKAEKKSKEDTPAEEDTPKKEEDSEEK